MRKKREITSKKESETLEFKSSFGETVIEALVAFANSKGGEVLIGLNDLGKPIPGFMIGKESISRWINEIKFKTQPSLVPDVEIVNIGKFSAVRFSLPEFPVKPVSYRGKYFKRVGNSNHQMTLNEITNQRQPNYQR